MIRGAVPLHHPVTQKQASIAAADTEDVLQTLPDLSRLNINGCISLSRLVLPECDKLTWVDCSGCASLRHIILASPALSELQVVSCQRLVVCSQPCGAVLFPLHITNLHFLSDSYVMVCLAHWQ